MAKVKRMLRKEAVAKKSWQKYAWLALMLLCLGVSAFSFHDQYAKYYRTLHQQDTILTDGKIEDMDKAKYTEEKIDHYSDEAAKTAQDKLKNGEIQLVGELKIQEPYHIMLPILQGMTNYNALSGAATMKEGQHLGRGNFALGSHSTYSPYILFGGLSRTPIGSSIFANDVHHIYQYKVYRSELIDPNNRQLVDDKEAKDHGTPIMTLLTCGDLHSTTRYVVQAELVDQWDADKAPDWAIEAFNGHFSLFNRAYRNMLLPITRI